VIRSSSVTTSVGGEATLRRGKGRDDASWTNANLTGQKMEKNHTVDSVATNGW
jgi:hypothetical protein